MRLDITDIILQHIWYLVFLITQIYLGHRLKLNSFTPQT